MNPTDSCYYPGCPDHISPVGPPVNPNPNVEALLAYHRKQAKWDNQHQLLPPREAQINILEYYATSKTAEDYLSALAIAELAGMGLWTQEGWEWTLNKRCYASPKESSKTRSKTPSAQTNAPPSDLNTTTEQYSKSHVTGGPRKELTIRLQLDSIGHFGYIKRYTTRRQLDRSIERIRKQAARAGDEQLLYQSVGDPTLGWILVSNYQLEDEMNRTDVREWYDRIIGQWHHSVNRMRRSRSLGRVSRLTYKRKGNSGQPSVWTFIKHVVDDEPWRTSLS